MRYSCTALNLILVILCTFSCQEGDAIDAELDKNEILQALPGELAGEKLLTLEYSSVVRFRVIL